MKPLGIGVIYNGVIDQFLDERPGELDFVSVIPERFWIDFGSRANQRFQPLATETACLGWLAERLPVVAHGVGMSLASAWGFDDAHAKELETWSRRYGFRWISEHLSTSRLGGGSSSGQHAGLAIPIPWDHAVLDLLTERVERAQDHLGEALCLENGVVHTPVPDPEMSEVDFMNELCARTGCGILLDLHNLHVNAVNLRTDPVAFLQDIHLENVWEIHIAGGNTLYGAYLDSHAGACPEEVWQLLDSVIGRTVNLRGITFEFHESYYPRLGLEGLSAELDRARAAWNARFEAADAPLCRSGT